MQGKRRKGRQKKRWGDNIKKWTGMDFASSTRAAEDRNRLERDCCKVISGAPTTSPANGIDYTRLDF